MHLFLSSSLNLSLPSTDLGFPMGKCGQHSKSEGSKCHAYQRNKKSRKLKNFIVSCSYCKQAVGRYLSLHMLGRYQRTLWVCLGPWGKTRWLSWVTASQLLCPVVPAQELAVECCEEGTCTDRSTCSHVQHSIFVSLICLFFRQTEKASWFASVVY